MKNGKYRPLNNEAEEQRWDELVHYAFAGSKSQQELDKLQQTYPLPRIAEKRGYFIDGEMVSTCSILPFEANLRQQRIPLAGLGEVTTAAEVRRRGYCRQMLFFWLKEMRKRNHYLSVLWPFSRSFYRKLGWSTCSEHTQFEFSPCGLKAVGSACESGEGYLRSFCTEDEVQIINEIYDRWASNYDMTITREHDWWRTTILNRLEGRLYTYLHVGPRGCPDGYVVYALVRSDGWDHRISVADLAYTNATAYRSMLRFLQGHQPQASEIRISRPMDDPLFLWVTGGKARRQKGVMMRVVDVKTALESMNYVRDIATSLRLNVTDEFATWNNASYILQIDGGRGYVRRCSLDCPSDPDVSLDVCAFSQLYTGYLTARQLAGRGDLVVKSDSDITVDLLQAVFPGRNTFMLENF